MSPSFAEAVAVLLVLVVVLTSWLFAVPILAGLVLACFVVVAVYLLLRAVNGLLWLVGRTRKPFDAVVFWVWQHLERRRAHRRLLKRLRGLVREVDEPRCPQSIVLRNRRAWRR